MAKRRAKQKVKQATSSPAPPIDGSIEPQINKKRVNLPLLDQEVERQIAATRAVRDVEIEHLVTGLRLLRSYFNEGQLQTTSLQFFKEYLPDLLIAKSGGKRKFEVNWKDKHDNLSDQAVGGRHMHSSLLRRLSTAYPDYTGVQSLAGFELSSDAATTGVLGADHLPIRDFVLEGPSDSKMLGMQDSLRTPGANAQRLSIGMTPKTLRLPKPGEMLLSVRGSPLGVYKEDNMEAIHESEEG